MKWLSLEILMLSTALVRRRPMHDQCSWTGDGEVHPVDVARAEEMKALANVSYQQL